MVVSTLGRNLERHRTSCGLTRPELAKKADVPAALITRVENGVQQLVDREVLQRLATALECYSISDLTGEAEPATPVPITAPASEQNLFRLPEIRRSVLNPRKTFDPEALEELAASIAANGLLQNLVLRAVEEDGITWYEVVAGERRYRALHILAERGQWDITKANVPGKLIEADDAKHLALALLENLQRKDVNAMEEAEAFASLIALDPSKWSTKAIADQLGCTQRHIQQRLALVEKLGEPAQAALRDGKITFSQARVLTMVPSAEQAKLVKDPDKLPPAPRLRDQVTWKLVPVDRAIFDPATYPGDIVENPETGERFFGNKDTFLKHQAFTALAKVEALKATWAWARIYEGYSFHPRHLGLDTDCDDRQRAGCVVHYNPYDGAVVVYERLAERVADAVAEEAAAKQRETERVVAQRHEQDVATFKAQLQTAILADPGAALLLALADGLKRDDYGDSILTHSYRRGLPSDLYAPAAPLHALADLVEPDNFHDITRPVKSNDQITTAWAKMRRLPGVNIRQAMERSIVERLAIWYRPHSPGMHPVLVEMARGYGLAIPECLQPAGQRDLVDAVNAAPAPAVAEEGGQEEVQSAPSPSCTLRGLDGVLFPEVIEELAAALPNHPHFGRLMLILEPADASGRSLSFMKAEAIGKVVYEAYNYDDGFKKVTVAEAVPAELHSFVSDFLDDPTLFEPQDDAELAAE
ncbi:ParB/RepB/Spo0J family partition protein [Azospirillum sp. sgz302134]